MKKMISLLLALVMALSLVACGAGNDTQNDDAAGTDTAPANALEQIKADGVLTVAVSPDFSPMEFVDSSKTGQEQYVGFDIELAKYTKAEDFSGVDVGAQNASLQMDLLTSQLPDANPVPIGDITVGVMELKSGNIEAMAAAIGNAKMIVDANPELMICDWQFEVAAEFETNVVLIAKGETELLNAVNEALAQAESEGKYAEWYEAAVALGQSENAKELTLD